MNTLDYCAGIFGSEKAKLELKNKKNSKIIILSDSHGNSKKLFSILKKHGSSADALLFAGDGLEDLLSVIKEAYISAEVKSFLPPVIAAVRGNCDGPSFKINYDFYAENIFPKSSFEFPYFLVLEAAGKKIFLTHGHMFGVELGLNALGEAARMSESYIAVFGHTHMNFEEVINNIFFVNSGSITNPRGKSEAGFAIMSIYKNSSAKVNFLK